MTHIISQDRTRNYIRQIKGSVIFKGLAIADSFFTIPMMIGYLGQEKFGVWSTLLSVMSWIVFFDLGLGNGLRNKLAESLAKNEDHEALSYISSAYTLIGLISISLFAVMALAAFLVPWQRVFNIHSIPEPALRSTVLIAAFFVFINFWVSLIIQVLNAVQKTSVVVFGQFLTNALSLAFVFTLTKTTNSSLLSLAAVYGVALVTSNILLSTWFYRQAPGLVPRFSLDSQHIRPLLSMGLQFFTIQIAVLLIFTTDKMLITQLFGPLYVTQYDVVFKLFSIVTIIHSLITAPLWSSYTDAYHRGDITWIKGVMRKQLMIFGGVALAVIILMLIAKPAIAMWIGKDIKVSASLIVSMGVFVLVSAWNSIFAGFLNGVHKIRISWIVSVIAMLFNIPVSILVANYTTLGTCSILIGTILSLLPGVFLGPYQTAKIIKFEDVGVWSR